MTDDSGLYIQYDDMINQVLEWRERSSVAVESVEIVEVTGGWHTTHHTRQGGAHAMYEASSKVIIR